MMMNESIANVKKEKIKIIIYKCIINKVLITFSAFYHKFITFLSKN